MLSSRLLSRVAASSVEFVDRIEPPSCQLSVLLIAYLSKRARAVSQPSTSAGDEAEDVIDLDGMEDGGMVRECSGRGALCPLVRPVSSSFLLNSMYISDFTPGEKEWGEELRGGESYDRRTEEVEYKDTSPPVPTPAWQA